MKISENDGHSLIELLVVVSIISVLTTLAVPAFATLQGRTSLDAETMKIKSLLRMLQAQAVADQLDRTIEIDTTSSTYRALAGSSVVGADALAPGLTFVGGPPTTFSVNNGRISIVFQPSGWGTGGTLVLRSSSGREKKIIIQVATGRVVVR